MIYKVVKARRRPTDRPDHGRPRTGWLADELL